jgi:hypothetical protein
MAAGKDVYCEKLMVRQVEEAAVIEGQRSTVGFPGSRRASWIVNTRLVNLSKRCHRPAQHGRGLIDRNWQWHNTDSADASPSID